MKRSFFFRSRAGDLYLMEYTFVGSRDGNSYGEMGRVLGYSITFGWVKPEDYSKEASAERQAALEQDVLKFHEELKAEVIKYRKERGL